MKNSTYGFWRRSGFKFWSVAGAIGLGACASQLPLLTQPQLEWASQRWPQTPPGEIEAGRTLYVMKCSGCHNLKLPQRYSAERWPKIMEKMGPKAKLTKDQEDLILRYALTLVEGPPPVKGH